MAELSEADKKTILGAAYEPPKAKSPGAPAKRTWSERLRVFSDEHSAVEKEA